MSGQRELTELRSSGLLWYINKVCLHPRGYALALHVDDEDNDIVTGWEILGNGTEPWQFIEEIDDECFPKFEQLLKENTP